MGNVTFEQMKKFLVKRYRHDRLYGRDGTVWGNYGDAVTNSHLEALVEYGVGFISQHESVTGEAIKYSPADVLGAC